MSREDKIGKSYINEVQFMPVSSDASNRGWVSFNNDFSYSPISQNQGKLFSGTFYWYVPYEIIQMWLQILLRHSSYKMKWFTFAL